MIEFRMPSLGADMEAGTLLEWLKKPGDAVKRGDIIAVVETQKAAMELEVFADGVIDRLLVKPGAKVPVGDVMAIIRSSDTASVPAVKEPIRSTESFGRPDGGTVVPPSALPSSPVGQELRITPAARRRVLELALDPAGLLPGPDGIIGLQEVEAAGSGAKPTRAKGIANAEMRAAIAAAMARSNSEIPHYYVSSTIDISRTMTWLAAENAKRSIADRILYTAPMIRAVARALAKAPELNGRFIDGHFQPSTVVNLGIAIALRGGGLIAPAIIAVDRLSLDEIMQRLRDLVARVRGGRLRGSEMTEGTTTLTMLGEDTADWIMPIIYPPQTAIIGCGRIADRPWIANGRIISAKTMTVTVAGDHRVSDGRAAAKFLNRLDQILQQPDTL